MERRVMVSAIDTNADGSQLSTARVVMVQPRYGYSGGEGVAQRPAAFRPARRAAANSALI